MQIHSSTREIVDKFRAAELHAARSGREVMSALARVVADSSAPNIEMLVAEIEGNIDAILEVMPAYAPPLNVLHQVMSWIEWARANQAPVDVLKDKFSKGSEDYRLWSETARARIAQYGASIIPEKGIVFTFTLSETVLRTLREAWKQGKKFRVLITESRPNNDGLMTAELLSRDGVAVEVSVDACIGELVSQADVMFVGAEAIMADGSAVCKVGTYPSALLAKKFGIPVFVVVDTMKFNVTSSLGLPLWMDPLESKQVLGQGDPGGAKVIGHLFDRTPPELLHGIVTERGILSPAACTTVLQEMCVSKTLSAKLSTWAYRKH
jgi:translation initiation factor 2B subunit (eIF-2B alpha/beta/delta family)